MEVVIILLIVITFMTEKGMSTNKFRKKKYHETNFHEFSNIKVETELARVTCNQTVLWSGAHLRDRDKNINSMTRVKVFKRYI